MSAPKFFISTSKSPFELTAGLPDQVPFVFKPNGSAVYKHNPAVFAMALQPLDPRVEPPPQSSMHHWLNATVLAAPHACKLSDPLVVYLWLSSPTPQLQQRFASTAELKLKLRHEGPDYYHPACFTVTLSALQQGVLVEAVLTPRADRQACSFVFPSLMLSCSLPGSDPPPATNGSGSSKGKKKAPSSGPRPSLSVLMRPDMVIGDLLDKREYAIITMGDPEAAKSTLFNIIKETCLGGMSFVEHVPSGKRGTAGFITEKANVTPLAVPSHLIDPALASASKRSRDAAARPKKPQRVVLDFAGWDSQEMLDLLAAFKEHGIPRGLNYSNVEERTAERIRAGAEQDPARVVPLRAVLLMFKATTVQQHMRDHSEREPSSLYTLITRLKREPYLMAVNVVITHLDELAWPQDYLSDDDDAAKPPKDVAQLQDTLGIIPIASTNTALGRVQAQMQNFLHTKVTFACLQVEHQQASSYVSCALAGTVLVKETLDAYATQLGQRKQRKESDNLILHFSNEEDEDEEDDQDQYDEEEQAHDAIAAACALQTEPASPLHHATTSAAEERETKDALLQTAEQPSKKPRRFWFF